MHFRLIRQTTPILLLLSTTAFAQKLESYPAAEKALEKVLQKKDFAGFQYDKHQIVSIKNNTKVPGLNGLMFAYYKNKLDGKRIMLSVQWFQDKEKLLAFHNSQIEQQKQQQKGLKKQKIAGSLIWANGDKVYYWTDGKNLAVSLGGASVPSKMLNAYLEAIPSGEENEKVQKDPSSDE